MSSHHSRKTVLKHYLQEEKSADRRNEASIARQEAFAATREAARTAGLAIKREILYLRMSELGWGIAWLTTLAVIVTTAVKIIG